jgi:hypothetical protein
MFEGLGGFVVLLNVQRILLDKIVRGVDWKVMGFFTAWGLWNLFYYPHLGQWLSFAAGVWIAVTNLAYLTLMVHYIRKEAKIDDRDDTLPG